MKIKVEQLVHNDGQVKGVPKNPRYIKDDDYKKLIKSLKDDPEYTDLNPMLVYDPEDGSDTLIVMGGNMRLRAIKELGWEEVECSVMPKDTPPKTIRARIIKHNHTYGKNDYDLLGNEWGDDPLPDFGVEFDSFAPNTNPNANRMSTTDEQIEREEADLIRKVRGENKEQLSVMCPYCAEEFYVNE